MSAFYVRAGRCRAGFALVLVLGCWPGAAHGEETDSRLHSDGKGWKLNRAKIADPTRPRVLLIGDSILGGYLKAVTAALEGQAYVDGWMNPYHQAAGNLEAMLGDVLAHGPYDVVHFNTGLHGWQPGRIPEGKFEPLTRRMVEIIRRGAPRATLIWASSTPVTVKGKPTELDPVIDPIIVAHNRLTAKVMAEAGVPVSDFYALLAPRLELARGDQFHWQAPAYAILAKAVVAAVRPRLPARSIAHAAPPSPEDERAIDAAFLNWKRSLSPAHQAWVAVLERNLGPHYLPGYKRQKVAGTPNAFDYVRDDPRLPRVLLIGDSVSGGYTRATQTALAGKANVHRAPENCGPTANGLKKLDVWLGEKPWDVIHFNFGIHDRATPPSDYAQRLEQIVLRLKRTGATLIWASTTPIPKDEAKRQDPAAIEALNAVAETIMRRHGIAIDDLHGWIVPDLGRFQRPNDVHFTADGYARLAECVAREIAAALPAPRADAQPATAGGR